MVSSNVERFNSLAANILSDLYQSFPVPHTITCGNYGDGQEFCPDDGKNEGLNFFMASVRWLAESGYIHYYKENTYLFFDAVLTAKGMEAMCLMPKSLSAQETLGERLTDAAKSGSKTAIIEAMKAVFAAGAAHFFK